MSSASHFPVLRVLGGALLIAAGLLAYSGINVGVSIFIVPIIGGAAVILLALVGHRPRGLDIAVFIIGLLVLSGVVSGYNPKTSYSSYSGPASAVHSNTLALTITAGTGSVNVAFADLGSLAYKVNFSQAFGPLTFQIPFPSQNSVSNSTSGGAFNLVVSATFSDVNVLLRRGYSYNISVSADTGSVNFQSTNDERIDYLSLTATTGSVSAVVDSSAVRHLEMHTSTGSISFSSSHLATDAARVPVILSSATGSISARLTFTNGVAVSLNAHVNLGGVSQNLVGFIISHSSSSDLVATAGNPSTSPRSFVVNATANLGSVSLDLTAGS